MSDDPLPLRLVSTIQCHKSILLKIQNLSFNKINQKDSRKGLNYNTALKPIKRCITKDLEKSRYYYQKLNFII